MGEVLSEAKMSKSEYTHQLSPYGPIEKSLLPRQLLKANS
jgi:hypothetical protein